MEQKYTYEKHCEEMGARGHDAMSEQHFKEMQDLEQFVKPKVRPKQGAKPKDPILDLYKDDE